MKNYLKIGWTYLDRLDQSGDPLMRILRMESYLVTGLLSFAVVLAVFSALMGVFFQFFVILWFLPKKITLEFVDQVLLQYGPLVEFNNDPTIILRSIFVLYDVIFFLLTTFIILKLKRRVRNVMTKKVDEIETDNETT